MNSKNPRILVLALSGIGDALMFTPALKLLKKSLPDAEVDVLIMFKAVRDFFEQMEEVDQVNYFDFMHTNKFKSLLHVLGLRGKYDYSISVYPSNRKEYNGINFLLGAKKRLAVKYNRMDLVEVGFLNNLRIQENDLLHNVEENVKMVEKITGEIYKEIPDLTFPLIHEHEQFATHYVKKNNPEGKLLVGFHAGCQTLKNHINRRWAPERFAELAAKLSREKDAVIFLFGGPEEDELKAKIKEMSGSADCILVNTKSLAETAALIKQCDVMVTNDSGLMHVSAAMKRKIVALIGPTNTNYIYPWNTEHKIASLNLECAPCFFYSPKPLSCSRTDLQYKCMKDLSVEKVYSLIEDMV